MTAATAGLENLFRGKVRGRLLADEPMSAHTSFRAGGPAELLFLPTDRGDLAAALAIAAAAAVPVLVVGNGTNLLVRDGGVRGLVVICRLLEGIREDAQPGAAPGEGRGRLAALAGTPLTRLINYAVKAGLAGLEFAAGIPGTIGGAVAMNAGAHGRSIGERVRWVDLADAAGRIERVAGGEIAFSYRSARLPRPGVIVEVGLELEAGTEQEVLAETKRCLEEHKRRLPFGHPHAGSVFRNPPGDHAGRLIEAAGCKGLTVGGAEVAGKHANVIWNVGNATAGEIEALMDRVRSQVRERFGVELEPEVRVVGEAGAAGGAR